jgi:protein involved in polysaccharide export with SLBB domain
MVRRIINPLCCALLALVLVAPPAIGQGERFTLRPGDVLTLSHWRDSLLRGDFPVETDGRVLLPVVGPRAVTSAPWDEVRDSLLAAFAAELRVADLSIIPKRRVYVLGFVESPGTALADPTTSFAGVIAMAQGASQEGDLTRIRIVRDGKVLADRVSIESEMMAQDVRSGDQIFVGRRGWFDRNSAFMVSAIVGLAGIVVTLLVVPR